jgi:uncharacterized protein (TIGR00369 family)
MPNSNTDPRIPAGFVPVPRYCQFNDRTGQIHRKGEGQDAVFGFLATKDHENPNGVLHGGMLMTFIDTVMGDMAQTVAGRFTATISLNVDFVASMPADGWVEGRPRLVRLTNTLAFMAGEAFNDGKLLISASGIWRVFSRTLAEGRGPSV